MALKSINPATEELLASFEELSKDNLFLEIEKSHRTFLSWKNTSFEERSELIKKAAEILNSEKERLANLITIEMGKPIVQSKAEVEKCAWVCEFYSEKAKDFLKAEDVKTDGSESYVQFDPLGVVLAVMPWNFPFWQVFRFAAPAIMAGNVGILKHASNVPQCALAIEDVFTKAGFPPNVFKSVLIGSSLVEEAISHPLVRAVTLTGSEAAGKNVAAVAGKYLKKTVLELGGSDPFLILSDANLDNAVKFAVSARLINNGQSCIAAKRFIVEKNIISLFQEKLVEEVSKIKIGDPLFAESDLGPVAREDLLLEIDSQIKRSIEKGAILLAGGKRFERTGYFYPATILTNVTKGMAVAEEETFGPVFAIISAHDEKDAIRIANDSNYGLGASIWTKDLKKAKELANQIESGSVFINGMVKSDPRLPFGGIKLSGYGRELSHYGIKEFVNIKSVWAAS